VASWKPAPETKSDTPGLGTMGIAAKCGWGVVSAYY
jgi:hypothetical protein